LSVLVLMLVHQVIGLWYVPLLAAMIEDADSEISQPLGQWMLFTWPWSPIASIIIW